jgi:hypothetical protein
MQNDKSVKWSDFERYLRAAHLGGRRVTVKIVRIEIEETHPRPGKTERAPVVYFHGKEKGLILSATNRRTLQDLFGDEIDSCIGKTVRIEAKPVTVGRLTKYPIRISEAPQREEKPATETSATPPITAAATARQVLSEALSVAAARNGRKGSAESEIVEPEIVVPF